MFEKGEKMKKKIIALCFVLALLFASSSFAFDFGLGIYAGKDVYKIPNLEAGFQLLDLTEASISRQGFSNPWLVGVSASFGINRNWSLRISGDVVLVKYEVSYSRNEPTFTNPFYVKTSTYKIDWGRAAILGTLQRHWRISNHLSLLTGTGGGLYILAPVVSDKFLVNTLVNRLLELNVSRDIDMSYKAGLHGLLGMEVAMLAGKMGLKLEGRYSLMSKGRYEEPTRFFSIFSCLVFHFKL